jgi:erythromycin esterase
MSITQPQRRSAIALAAAISVAVCPLSTQAAVAGEPAVAWIDRNAVPVRTDASGPVEDLRPLRGIVRGARIVGLGEPSHGAHEQVTLRHRAVRYLVERLGFRTVAWEENWATGVAIDRYIVSGHGDPREVVADMNPLWQHQAMLDLVRWMREFNRTRPPGDKVRFLGSDVTELRALPFQEITQYVREVAPGRLDELNRHLKPIWYRGSAREQFEWYGPLPPARKQEVIEHARAVARLVLSLPARPSRIDRGYAIQHANAILGFYETYAEDMTTASAPVRDRHIADTISWWQRRTRQRIVYGAANVHTTAIPRVTWTFPSDNVTFTNKVMAGGHLRLRYGRSYVSIGTVSRTGRIRGGFETGQPSVFTVPPPRPPTVDHVLGQARHRTYLLDLRAPASPPVRRWLDAPATMRLIGSAYDAGKDADFTMTVGSFRRGFDAVFHIGAVTPTRPLDQ